MINDTIKKITDQICEILPYTLKKVKKDISKKVYQILQSKIMQTNVVSREEFEIQKKVLLKTREKLVFLEKRFLEIEKYIQNFDKKDKI